MDYEPKDVMVLGAIMHKAKKFEQISKETKIPREELDAILERLEKRGLIQVETKRGWFGNTLVIRNTEKGNSEVGHRLHELRDGWQKLVQLYKSGDKKNLGEQMDGFRGVFPMMMFFGIVDIMMFSMMFDMIGSPMADYIPSDQMPDSDGLGDGMDDDFGLDLGF